MAISNIPLPSFTLVLTTGHPSDRRHPATITYALPPSVPDHLHLMTFAVGQENADLPTIFKEAEPSSSGGIAKKAGYSIKANLLLFLHKFVFKPNSAIVKEMSSSM